MSKLITFSVIIVLIIVGIFVCSAEYDRLLHRNIPMRAKYFYFGSLGMLAAPIHTMIKLTALYQNDLNAISQYPDLETNFPNHHILTDNYQLIMKEAARMWNNGDMTDIKGDMFFVDIVEPDKWKKFYIKWYGDILPDAWENCPETCKLIESLPEVRLAMISVLSPRTHIYNHMGSFKGSFRYHLGLQTPNSDNCFLEVDNIPYSWRDGEAVLFDDTYQHYVRNDTDQYRFILFCDVQRDLHSTIPNAINNFACEYLAPLTTRTNSKNEEEVTDDSPKDDHSTPAI